MKKIAIILLFVSVKYFSQEILLDKTTDSFSKKRLGICFSPNMGYRTLVDDAKTSYSNSYVSGRNDNEHPMFCYNAGITFGYFFKPNTGITFDILYSQKRYRTNEFESWDYDINGNITDNYTVYYVNEVNTLDIPIKFNFGAGKKKVLFTSSIGFSTCILLDYHYNAYKTHYKNSKTIQSNSNSRISNPLYFSFDVSTGAEIILNKLMRVKIQPTFRHAFSDLFSADIYGVRTSEFLWTAGVNLGYIFCF